MPQRGLTLLHSRVRDALGLRNWGARAFGDARRWSNTELRAVAHLFTGDIINVSAWEDLDKEGKRYSDYFTKAQSYSISNFGTDQGVMQGLPNEIYLDLQAPLPGDRIAKYDVVFNHTVLEHVYDFRTAFANLCALSRDVVIVVVPWLQPHHTDYGDYWRFSPQAITRMFADNGLTTHYVSYSALKHTAVYVFAIASKNPAKWAADLGAPINTRSSDFLALPAEFAGKHAL